MTNIFLPRGVFWGLALALSLGGCVHHSTEGLPGLPSATDGKDRITASDEPEASKRAAFVWNWRVLISTGGK